VVARLRATVVKLVTRPRAAPEPVLDDAEILAAVRRGDGSAATAFYRRTRPTVERTLLRILGRRDRDHDDLSQLATIAVVQSIASFRGECSLDTWTARITARTLFKELRRRKSEGAVFESDDSSDAIATGAADTHRDVSARSSVERVRKHLGEMDPLKAWTVVLHDVCGHDLREIAEITDVTVAAAQTRLARGRTELHERIQRDPDLAGELSRRGGRS
jgi:RNA polymerase sigma-70 factor (ECF subfamily)